MTASNTLAGAAAGGAVVWISNRMEKRSSLQLTSSSHPVGNALSSTTTVIMKLFNDGDVTEEDIYWTIFFAPTSGTLIDVEKVATGVVPSAMYDSLVVDMKQQPPVRCTATLPRMTAGSVVTLTFRVGAHPIYINSSAISLNADATDAITVDPSLRFDVPS